MRQLPYPLRYKYLSVSVLINSTLKTLLNIKIDY